MPGREPPANDACVPAQTEEQNGGDDERPDVGDASEEFELRQTGLRLSYVSTGLEPPPRRAEVADAHRPIQGVLVSAETPQRGS